MSQKTYVIAILAKSTNLRGTHNASYGHLFNHMHQQLWNVCFQWLWRSCTARLYNSVKIAAARKTPAVPGQLFQVPWHRKIATIVSSPEVTCRWSVLTKLALAGRTTRVPAWCLTALSCTSNMAHGPHVLLTTQVILLLYLFRWHFNFKITIQITT